MGTSFQPCVWVPPDSPVFPLVKVLPSTDSATLPGCCSPASSVLRPCPTSCGSPSIVASAPPPDCCLLPSRRPPQDLSVPVQRGSVRAWGLRLRVVVSALALTRRHMLRSACIHCVRTTESDFGALSPSPHVPLSTLRRPLSGSRRMTRGQRGSLLLRCWTLSFLPLCRSSRRFRTQAEGPGAARAAASTIRTSRSRGTRPEAAMRRARATGGAAVARDPWPLALPSPADTAPRPALLSQRPALLSQRPQPTRPANASPRAQFAVRAMFSVYSPQVPELLVRITRM